MGLPCWACHVVDLPLVRVVSLVLLALVVAGQSSASASVRWCRSDPLVVIDGHLVDVFVSIPTDDLSKVTGATQIVVIAPPDVAVALASPGVGFGYGEDVSFETSPSLDVTTQGMEIRARVLVPASDDAVPVLVELAPRIVGIVSPTAVEGLANAWVSQRATI